MNIDIGYCNRNEILHVVRDKRALTEVETTKLAGMMQISSSVYSGMIDGELVCIWGFVPPSLLSDEAYLWLCATPRLEDHKFLFIRHSQRVVEKMLETYPRIVGFCDEGNRLAIQWITWLGGRFDRPVNGRVNFEITRKLHG